MAEKVAFETALAQLEQAVEALEKGELSLEESIQKFEQGVALAARCAEVLKDAELKVRQLVKRAEGAFDLEVMEGPREETPTDEEGL